MKVRRPGWRAVAIGSVVLVVALVLPTIVSGTGGGSSSSSGIQSELDASVGSAEPATGETAGSGAVGDLGVQSAPAAVPGQARGVPAQGVPVGLVGRELVRTAQLTVEVPDVDVAGRAVRTVAAAAGGVVAQEQSDDGGALLVLRVPAQALDRVIEQVGEEGEILARSGQVEDATEQLVDLDSRVASQQAAVVRVRDLLAAAESIGDVVAVESELARREAELDSLVSRLTALRDQVDVSTLTVDLRMGPAVTEPGPTVGFSAGLGAGWDGLRAVGAVLAAAAGFVLPFLPVLAVLAALAWLGWRVLRGRVRPGPAAAGGGGGPGHEGVS